MQIVMHPIGEIKPYPGNPRVNADAVPAVAAAIREFGFRNPILLDADGVIVAGHTRLAAAQSLGMVEVPVVFITDLSPDRIRALRLADNQTASLSTWQEELLFRELEGLRAAEVDLSTLGFSDAEFACILAPAGIDGHTDPDEVPEPPERPYSESGVVYAIGRHRLLCLDNELPDADGIDRLMTGERADLVLTDLTGVRAEASALAPTFAAVDTTLRPGGAFYLWHSDLDACRVREVCAAVGWEIRQGLVWDRGSPSRTGTPTPGAPDDYVRCHENCAYGWKDGAPHQWFSDRCQTTALAVEGTALPDNRKPVDALAYLVGNSCPPGGLIFDPFAGSGATLITAERTGRRAHLVAATPADCDVIRRRWTAFVFGPVRDWINATPRMEDGHAAN